ncbi:hypothetical protein AAV35_006540 [Salimicrobium jeotgali]|uniref:Cupin type-2 domain-containing protein n=1 Tax=Salimicrobium jeotgali TaxID=1230341 RepID=K2HAW1_9BACI|nr:cupin domain-containing protein [Salimicrobium jeotgali]AKG04477.1 hypothetical protein AAV35_006540 [Salimicrobium jeotgali]EKE32685.1 hypothetical protein MJ3_01967 [Salimicrobium jeotgali]MBM7695329.1 quercetin dioxygenase-like cupin family protein [Salimicrobium jeotgali]
MHVYSIEDAKQFNDERFTKVNLIKNDHSTAFVLNFLPGQHMKAHNHPHRELYLYVIDGDGIFLIDDEEVAVSAGDVIYCDSKQQLGFTNTSDARVSIYATMTKLQD